MVNPPDHGTAITFQGKDPEEEFRFYFRQHWVRMIGTTARTAFFTAAIFLSAWLVSGLAAGGAHQLLLLLLAFFFLLVQWEFLLRFYRYFLHVVIVTDKKIHRIKKTFLAYDDHQSIDLWVLQDIHKSQRGPLQSILNYGSLTLEAQDTHLRLHFVPSIRKRYDDFLHLRELARGAMMAGRAGTGPQTSSPR